MCSQPRLGMPSPSSVKGRQNAHVLSSCWLLPAVAADGGDGGQPALWHGAATVKHIIDGIVGSDPHLEKLLALGVGPLAEVGRGHPEQRPLLFYSSASPSAHHMGA